MLSLFTSIIKSSFKFGIKNILLVFFLIFINVFLEIIGLSLIIPIINIFIDPNIIDRYLNIYQLNNINRDDALKFILILFFIIFLFKSLFTIIIEYVVVKLSKKWEINLILKCLNNHFNKSWIDVLKTHDPLIKNITVDIPSFVQQGLITTINLIKNLIILLSIFVYLIYQKGSISLLILLLFSSFFYFIFKIFKKFLTKLSDNFNNNWNHKYNLTNEITNGFKEIKIQNLKNYFLKEYSDNEQSIARIDIVKKISIILPKILIELVTLTIFLFIMFYNVEDSLNFIPLLGLLAFIIYRSQPIMVSLVQGLSSLQLFKKQINNGIEILNLSLKYTDYKKKELENNNLNISENSILEIKNLEFSYNDNNKIKKIFNNLNIALEFGNIYALIGKNGLGKTTFADLIVGLLKPDKGEILFDNKNINELSSSWNSSVSYLSQNFFLFKDTIRNNITLESKNSNIFSDERYKNAIQISNLNDEINKFQNKENFFLSDSGNNISGGQKQRIAIARLIYKGSKIVILDEPTASLDKLSSELMIEMLRQIKKDKLIIIISHSDKIINFCDKIIEINNQKINVH
jgi:ABC-type bacteriocin/lantibiotic exporter with double-glycine peptidase domain